MNGKETELRLQVQRHIYHVLHMKKLKVTLSDVKPTRISQIKGLPWAQLFGFWMHMRDQDTEEQYQVKKR